MVNATLERSAWRSIEATRTSGGGTQWLLTGASLDAQNKVGAPAGGDHPLDARVPPLGVKPDRSGKVCFDLRISCRSRQAADQSPRSKLHHHRADAAELLSPPPEDAVLFLGQMGERMSVGAEHIMIEEGAPRRAFRGRDVRRWRSSPASSTCRAHPGPS